MKRQITGFLVLVFLLVAYPARAFTNRRYLAYGRKSEVIPLKIIPNYIINNSYISGLVTNDINKLVAEGLLKGQKGDKGDPGTPAVNSFGSSSPGDGVAAPAPVTYNSNIPGSISGFTELSAGDLTVGTSLTVSSGPVEISPAANLEVDGSANFTASTTMADLNVATIEAPVSITTQNLEVGSGDLPTGITIYDTVTKEPVCIFSANNVLQSLQGQCGTAAPTLPQVASVPDSTDPPVASSTLDSLDNASSSPGDIPDVPPPINPSQPTSTIESASTGSTSTSTLSN